MKFFDSTGIDIGYVVIGITVVLVLLFILLIISMVKIRNMRIAYEKFMEGEDGKSLEKTIQDKFASINSLEDNVQEIKGQINDIIRILEKTYKKIGLVKYDAFEEVGGQLSFVLVLLTSENDGFILNSMYSSREGCFTYIKEVVNGETFITLSKEEQQALNEAKHNAGLNKQKNSIEQAE